MDISSIESSKEALFADIMASTSNGSAETQRRGKLLKVEKRENRRRDGSKKQRPVSMTTFPPSSAYDKPSSAAEQCNGLRGGIASILGRGFPFSKPKAFFSSEQHLPGRVDGYNRSHEQLYQLKPLAASQVRYLAQL